MSTTTEMIHAGNGAALRPAGESPREEFLSPSKVELLKRTICDGATDDELELFVAQCRRTGLDPFVRQIHAVKRWNGDARREVMTIQVGIDGLRLIAERTGHYAPGADTEYAYDQAGALLKATAYVKKWVHGEWHVVAGSALWAEYCQVKKDGAPMAMWGRLPHVMLEKCAEARALRRAFPQETSGLYIHEEMAQADSEPVAPTRREATDVAPAPVTAATISEERRDKVARLTDLLKGTPKEYRDALKARIEERHGVSDMRLLGLGVLDELYAEVRAELFPAAAETPATEADEADPFADGAQQPALIETAPEPAPGHAKS